MGNFGEGFFINGFFFLFENSSVVVLLLIALLIVFLIFFKKLALFIGFLLYSLISLALFAFSAPGWSGLLYAIFGIPFYGLVGLYIVFQLIRNKTSGVAFNKKALGIVATTQLLAILFIRAHCVL